MNKFRDLDIGQSFDWIDDNQPGYNSFFDRCIKTGDKEYRSLVSNHVYKVGSINARVFHLGLPMPIHSITH